MTYFAGSDSVSYLAAQLALLVLRAGVSRELPLVADRIVLAPAPTSISIEDATQRLAGMPKPLLCRAYPFNNVLTVTCTALQDASPHEQQWYRLTREEETKRGSYLWYLDDEYGKSTSHPVLVFGRNDETLMLPSSAVDAWHRDYDIRGVNSTGDGVNNPYAAEKPSHLEAKRRGAHGLLTFSSPLDSEGRISVVTFPPSQRKRDETPEPNEAYLIEFAYHFYQRLLLERLVDSMRDRESVPRARDADDQAHYRETIRELTEQMHRYYATRAMPRIVTVFLDECSRHPWCRPHN